MIYKYDWCNRIKKKKKILLDMKHRFYCIFKSVCTVDTIYFARDRTKIANVVRLASLAEPWKRQHFSLKCKFIVNLYSQSAHF